MGTVINAEHGKLLFPHGSSLGWLADCSELEIELSVEWDDFLWSCRYRKGMAAAGTLVVNSINESIRDDVLMDLGKVALEGYLLDVDTAKLEELEALRFPNVLFQLSPLTVDKPDEIRFSFLGCPEILRWYK